LYRVRLTEAQRAELQRRTRDVKLLPRTRDRLEMVRLADAAWSIPRIAVHLHQSEKRVRYWVKGFLTGGFGGLPDQPHVGQMSQLTPGLVLQSHFSLVAGPTAPIVAAFGAHLMPATPS